MMSGVVVCDRVGGAAAGWHFSCQAEVGYGKSLMTSLNWERPRQSKIGWYDGTVSEIRGATLILGTSIR